MPVTWFAVTGESAAWYDAASAAVTGPGANNAEPSTRDAVHPTNRVLFMIFLPTSRSSPAAARTIDEIDGHAASLAPTPAPILISRRPSKQSAPTARPSASGEWGQRIRVPECGSRQQLPAVSGDRDMRPDGTAPCPKREERRRSGGGAEWRLWGAIDDKRPGAVMRRGPKPDPRAQTRFNRWMQRQSVGSRVAARSTLPLGYASRGPCVVWCSAPGLPPA